MAEKLDTTVRQEQIAEAALDVIARHGMAGLSIANVARRVGIVPSAIYRHFEGKDQVLDAVLDLIKRRLLANVRSVRSETDDAVGRLRALLMRYVALIRENEGLPRVVFSEAIYSGAPERKRRLYGIIADYLDRVAEIVGEGQREGRIRSGIAPDKVAVMFLGMVQPGAILWHLSDGEFDVIKQAEKAWEVFEAALEPAARGGGRQAE
jgi:AcrR family transcriptional regulator